MRLEPPAVAAAAQRPAGGQGPARVHDLIASLRLGPPDPRAAYACAGLAAAVVGLLGGDGGLLWLVAGVWAVRAVSGVPVGLAWGLACVGAGMRWGTLGLGDLEVATRVAGPTILAGPAVVRAGMIAAFVACLVAESQAQGLLARTWGERAVAAIVAASLGPLFIVPGPTWPVGTDALSWAGTGVAATTVLLFGRRPFERVPRWTPSVVTAVGVAAALAAS